MEQFYTVRIVFWRRPYPHTSLMRDRTAFVFVERTPLLRDGRGGSSRRRTTRPLFMPTAMPRYQHIVPQRLFFGRKRPVDFINASISFERSFAEENIPSEARAVIDTTSVFRRRESTCFLGCRGHCKFGTLIW